MLTNQNAVSLDAPILSDDDNSSNLQEIIAFSDCDFTQDIVNKDTVRFFINCLPEREKKIIYYRFYDQMTLAECGQMLGITRERVRQIELKALEKMRRKGMAKNA